MMCAYGGLDWKFCVESFVWVTTARLHLPQTHIPSLPNFQPNESCLCISEDFWYVDYRFNRCCLWETYESTTVWELSKLGFVGNRDNGAGGWYLSFA